MDALGNDASEDAIKAKALGFGISDTDYDVFRKVDYHMALTAVGDNKYWSGKVEEILANDVIKTGQNLNIKGLTGLKDGKSILGSGVFTQLSEMADLKVFRQNETTVNEMLEKHAQLAGHEYAELRDTKDSAKAMDDALSYLKGKVDEDTFKNYEAESVMRYRIEKYDQETMAKAAKGVIGSMNVSLNTTKLVASKIFGGTGDVGQKFKEDLIWEVNRIKEQAPISNKKMIIDYDETRINTYGEISRSLFNKGPQTSAGGNIDQMREWMDTFMEKDDLVNYYDRIQGTYIDDAAHKKIIAGKTTKDAIKDAKYTHIRDSYLGSLAELATNDVAKPYRNMFNSVGRSGDKYNVRLGSDEAVSQTDTMTGLAMSFIRPDAHDAGSERMERIRDMQRKVKEMQDSRDSVSDAPSNALRNTAASIGEAAETIGTGLVKSFSGAGSSGLAMGALGLAGGLMASGYASGNPLNDANPQTITQGPSQQNNTMSIPQFLDEEGGYVTGNSQRGYIINIKADTKKGRKHMERAMKQAAQASVGGSVSVNMSIKNSDNKGFTDRDVEKYIERNM
jgi:hypothetical protein